MYSIAENYRSSLQDMTHYSKPHITVLTELAKEYIAYAALIVETIVDHIRTVQSDLKLPVLYLVDSIIRNHGQCYIDLFGKHLVSLFKDVFSKNEALNRDPRLGNYFIAPQPVVESVKNVVPLQNKKQPPSLDFLNEKRSAWRAKLDCENTGPSIKKGKFTAPVEKMAPGTESYISTYAEDLISVVRQKTMLPTDQRLTESYLGSKDMDYRRQPINAHVPENWSQQTRRKQQRRSPNKFYCQDGNINNRHANDIFAVEKSSDSPCPHPVYRGERTQLAGRPLTDQCLPVNTQAQAMPLNSSWWLKTQSTLTPPSFDPPPSVCLFLPQILPNMSSPFRSMLRVHNSNVPPPNLSSRSRSMFQIPNVNVPPPNWNSMPSPPTLTSSLLDAVKHVSLFSPVATNTMHIPPEVMNAPTTAPPPSLPLSATVVYKQLVASGLIAEKPKESTDKVSKNTVNSEDTSTEKKESVPVETPEAEILLTAESLRQYRPSLIDALYKGSQCAMCGMRFKKNPRKQYSQHLDWHFRMNRQKKEKKANSRSLFYGIKDWSQFVEVEDTEERAPSYFESHVDGNMTNDEKENIQSISTSECRDENCSVCGERFDFFWIDDAEEWHIKNAMSHNGKAYHPMCYEDFKKTHMSGSY